MMAAEQRECETMEQKNGDQDLLQLGDLARQAGMSLSAVKHCVR